jgi:hypothetical protein
VLNATRIFEYVPLPLDGYILALQLTIQTPGGKINDAIAVTVPEDAVITGETPAETVKNPPNWIEVGNTEFGEEL